MLHSEMVFPIVRPRFVDRCVLLGRHLFRFPLPERFLRISHFLLLRFRHVQLDGVADEFKVYLHQILQELELVLPQVTNDLRASLDLLPYHYGVFLLGERTTSRRLPDVLFIVTV